jgi:hypothetical protein
MSSRSSEGRRKRRDCFALSLKLKGINVYLYNVAGKERTVSEYIDVVRYHRSDHHQATGPVACPPQGWLACFCV